MTDTPKRGDVVHLDFSPQVGHEMKRPHYGLVVSALIRAPLFHIAMLTLQVLAR